MKKYIVAPSILTADFLNLKKELDNLWAAGIRWIHYDVMDYNFVPNLSFGPKILNDIVKNFDFKIDIHLMVSINNLSVKDYLQVFVQKNVFQITVHYEALTEEQLKDFFDFCRENKIISSLAISPDTSVEKILSYLPLVENILVMTVYPGFGGQVYLPKAGAKIEVLKKMKKENNFKYSIEVDGGINEETYQIVKEHGVEMIVAGSYLVGQTPEVLQERIKKLEK